MPIHRLRGSARVAAAKAKPAPAMEAMIENEANPTS